MVQLGKDPLEKVSIGKGMDEISSEGTQA